MLPGFRFLFGAVVLLMSILVFGFGAAALLRTAHEEFASAPAWRPAPETRFAQAHEPTPPVLALLRVDDAPKDTGKDTPPALNDVPANAAADPVAAPSPQPDLDKTTALAPADTPPSEAAKPDTDAVQNPVSENPPQADATLAPADAPATAQTKLATTEQPSADAPAQVTAPAATQATNQATEDAAPASETVSAPAAVVAPAPPEQASMPNSTSVSARVATLGGPAVSIAAPTKDAVAKHERNLIRKRQARRAAQRRRIALRRAQLQAAQQLPNPFTPLPVAR
jgi:hypothetical protein